MADQFFELTYNDREIQRLLEAARSRTQNLTPVMKTIGELILLDIDDNFRFERAPDGTPWPKNSPRTIAMKRAEGRINKILQSTGRMRAATTYRAESDRVTVSNNTSYAAKNQLGRNAPQRKFIGISRTARTEIIGLLEGYVANGAVAT